MDKNNLSIVSLVVSLATLILVAYSSFFGVSQEVNKGLMNIEALKVGGMENYKLVQEIYNSEQFKTTQAKSLKEAVAQFKGGAQQPGDSGTESPTPTAQAEQKPGADGFTRGTLTADQIASVTKDVKFEGKDSAKIALIEYSDIECPFCQRHFSSKTVATVLEKHADAVKVTFKNFPLSFHATAQKAAEAVLCAAKQDKLFEFKDAAFEGAIASADKKPTKEVLLAAAKKVGLKEAEFSKCLDSDETADKVKSEMNEGSSLFGVTGTPGNVLINLETGKYVVVAGAYPAAQFDAIVTELSK